jgi:hypothetical protein
VGGNDLVNTMVAFSEEDIHVVGGFLAETWNVTLEPEQVTVDIDQAITAVCRYPSITEDRPGPDWKAIP